jgi:sugar phosphate isomerase/epimerase
MERRTFIKNSVLAAGAAICAGGDAWALPARPFGPFKLGAISDGFSQDLEQALKIMKGFGLQWVEIRDIWGKYNTEATPEEIRRVKSLMERYHFKCSVVDSNFYKCTLPRTKPVSREGNPYPYSQQMDLLKRACARCHAWGTDKVRGFTFFRVAEPEKIYPRISEELSKAAEVARQEGVRLVIENEESCNGATGRETAAILKMTPAPNLGFNWDVGNGYSRGEVSYPDGWNALDKSRVWHLHLKGMQCSPGLKACHESFPDAGVIDLTGQLKALERIHYDGSMSLECEFKAPGMTHQQTTERAMQGLIRDVKKALA